MSKQLAQHPHKLFFLLSDPTRLRILCLLQRQSLCVTDLMEIIGALQPAISNHLRKLLKYGLVHRRPNGHRWIVYSLAPAGDSVTAAILNAVVHARHTSRQLARDAAKLKKAPRRP